MKKFVALLLSASLFLTLSVDSRAELLTLEYGININDSNPYKDSNNFFQLFNAYFAEQLGIEGLFASSNELFNARGVDPYTDWTTNGSELVGAYKVAALGHDFSVFDSEGTFISNLMNLSGTENISKGITDLTGDKVVGIADGLHVNFQLDAYHGSQLVYSWSSDPDGNGNHGSLKGDGKVHMVALDITDLYNAKYGTKNDSVYMFGWEDLHLTAAGGGLPADWDYQDFVAIMTNLSPDTTTTPEPATILIFGLGLAAIPTVRRFRKK